MALESAHNYMSEVDLTQMHVYGCSYQTIDWVDQCMAHEATKCELKPCSSAGIFTCGEEEEMAIFQQVFLISILMCGRLLRLRELVLYQLPQLALNITSIPMKITSY